MTTRKQRFSYAILVSCGLAASPSAFAGPAITGLAAQADTAESAFGVPAGMSRLDGNHLSVQAMVAISQSRFDVDESKTEVDGGDPNRGQDPFVIPSVYYVRQLNDDWHAGVSLSVPTGFNSDYGSTWAGRYEAVDFTLAYIALTPALSYRINDRLSVGTKVAINYTASQSEVKIPQPLEDSDSDAKVTTDLDGIGISVGIGVLYEFSERTRAAIGWTSDSKADMEGDTEVRNLAPASEALFSELGLTDIDTEVTNKLPQNILAGVYHELESGNFITIDAAWMKFSDFSVTDIKVEGQDVGVSVPLIFKDIWLFSAGMGFPVNEKMTYNVGAMYLSQGVNDNKRPLTMRLDAMWGVGAGLNYELNDERSVELNATLINLGDAPVDTGTDSGQGRLVGESTDPYAFLFELTYNL